MDITEVVYECIKSHPGCSEGRIGRLHKTTPATEITKALATLSAQFRIKKTGKKLYIVKNPETAEFNAKRKVMFDEDLHHKILRQTRTKMIRLLNRGKTIRDKKFSKILGCSIKEFSERLESQFEPGMNWQNHGVGKGKWHIDHIKPCAEHDLTDPEDFAACWHYSNMRPLWADENLRLGATVRRKYHNKPKL